MRERSGLLCAAFAALALFGAAAQSGETRIAQSFDVGTRIDANQTNQDSPFLRLIADPDAWTIGSTVSSSYALTFSAPGVSGRASLSASASAPADFSFSLDQCWARATLADGWGLKFGRFDLNWRDGGGRWNPSDIVNNKASWGEIGPVSGRDAIELLGSIPLPDFAVDLNLATAFSSKIDSPADLPVYLALGSILYPVELRLKAALPPGAFLGDSKPLFGASAKCSLGSLNAYADALCLFENPIARELGQTAEGSFWTRWCLGANYAFGFESSPVIKSLSLGAEYLRQDDGLSRENGNDYFRSLRDADLLTSEGPSPYEQEASLWGGRFFALYRDYLSLSVGIGGIGRERINADLGGIVNLDDGSFVVSSSVSWEPRGLFSIRLRAQNYGGPGGSEGRQLPIDACYTLSLDKSF